MLGLCSWMLVLELFDVFDVVLMVMLLCWLMFVFVGWIWLDVLDEVIFGEVLKLVLLWV